MTLINGGKYGRDKSPNLVREFCRQVFASKKEKGR
jgi:hypothetical protein|tara:strand:- start:135 stop:239 length:105 start_codon:yes stop_codon:yes gene_type:complete